MSQEASDHAIKLLLLVWKYGTREEAARRADYGVTADGIRKQIVKLERDIRVQLYNRKTGALTPAADRLCLFARRYHDDIDGILRTLPGRQGVALTVGISDFNVRHYAGLVLKELLARYPGVYINFRSGNRQQIIDWLKYEEIDAGFTLLDGAGEDREIAWKAIRSLRPVLVVPAHLPQRTSEEFFAEKVIRYPLVTPPDDSAVTDLFQRFLATLGRWWPNAAAISSSALIAPVTGESGTIGLTVNVPLFVDYPGTRILELSGMPDVQVAVMWNKRTGPLHPLIQSYLPRIAAHADWERRPPGRGTKPRAVS